jgi:hypothetical protein
MMSSAAPPLPAATADVSDGSPSIGHERANRAPCDRTSDRYQAGHGAWIATTPAAWGALADPRGGPAGAPRCRRQGHAGAGLRRRSVGGLARRLRRPCHRTRSLPLPVGARPPRGRRRGRRSPAAPGGAPSTCRSVVRRSTSSSPTTAGCRGATPTARCWRRPGYSGPAASSCSAPRPRYSASAGTIIEAHGGRPGSGSGGTTSGSGPSTTTTARSASRCPTASECGASARMAWRSRRWSSRRRRPEWSASSTPGRRRGRSGGRWR